jgi:hypothetical protein
MNPTTPYVKNNNCVSWTSFLTILGIALTMGVALNTFVWAQHGRTMDQFEKRMVEQFDNVKDRLNRIDSKLERIK